MKKSDMHGKLGVNYNLDNTQVAMLDGFLIFFHFLLFVN